VRERSLGAEERSEEIDLDDAAPRVRAHRFRRHVKIAGGVIHEQIQPAVLPRDVGDHHARALRISHVQRRCGCLPASSSQPFGRGLDVLGPSARHYDMHSERRQELGNAETDSGAPSGNDPDLTGKQPVAEYRNVSHSSARARTIDVRHGQWIQAEWWRIVGSCRELVAPQWSVRLGSVSWRIGGELGGEFRERLDGRVEIERQLANSHEAASVVRRQPGCREAGNVVGGGIAGVLPPAIRRILLAELPHEPVAGDLRR
jgi:hypothetical protein